MDAFIPAQFVKSQNLYRLVWQTLTSTQGTRSPLCFSFVDLRPLLGSTEQISSDAWAGVRPLDCSVECVICYYQVRLDQEKYSLPNTEPCGMTYLTFSGLIYRRQLTFLLRLEVWQHCAQSKDSRHNMSSLSQIRPVGQRFTIGMLVRTTCF